MLRDASATWSSPTRSSRSCQDSVNPCLAWARSPTMVKLRDGQRRSSICHSASVSSWASSTTMWANGPASRSGSALGRAPSSTHVLAQVVAAQHRHHVHLGVVGRRSARRRPRPSVRAGPPRPRRGGACGGTPRGRRAAAGPRRGAAGRTPSTHAGPPCAAAGPRPGSARVRTSAGTPAPTTGRRPRRRPRAAARPSLKVRAQLGVPLQRRTYLVGGDLVVVVLVDQDGEQLVPDLVARLVVRRPGVRRRERLGPLVGAQPDVGPRRSRRASPRWAAPRRAGRPARSRAPSRRWT